MKKTLFLASLLTLVHLSAQGSVTYQDFSQSFIDHDNSIAYEGNGHFVVQSDAATTVDLTISLTALNEYVNLHDYAPSYMLLWDDNVLDYGLADGRTEGTETYTPTITGWSSNKHYTDGTPSAIDYATLQQYAVDNSITLHITNSSSDGVTISTSGSDGSDINLYTAPALRASTNTQTNGYYINTHYVTSVTFHTPSTLDTASYVPPTTYPDPYVSSRDDGTSVGRVLFVGDSITHGINNQTHRWQLFKTLVDNGIENQIVGPLSGYDSRWLPVDDHDAGNHYGDTTFNNVHLAQSSGRSYELISDSNTRYAGHSTGNTAPQYNSDTYITLIGTNDLLSDTKSQDAATTYAPVMQNLLGGSVTYNSETATYAWEAAENGNLQTIANDLLHEDTDVMYLLSIPTWGDNNRTHGNDDTSRVATQQYNQLLQQWVETYNSRTENTGRIVYVDVNRGLVDVSAGKFMGPDSFFHPNDGLHPTEQGALIIAGNLAQGMGIGGRTAGLTRADQTTADTTWESASIGTDGTVKRGVSYLVAKEAFTQDGGYTVDFHATAGNGASDGWLNSAQALSISVGDGTHSGTLNLSEGYIMWGDTLLYCQDNSAMSDNLRIAWHNGNSTDNVLAGYYVWLGDMLIGQGLEADTQMGLNGIAISSQGINSSVTNLSWSNTAYAPTTTLTTSTDYAYHTQQAEGRTDVVQNLYLWHNNTATITTSSVSYSQALTTTITENKNTTLITRKDAAPTHILTTADADTPSKVWVGIVNCVYEQDIAVQYTGNISATIFAAMGESNAKTITLEIAAGSIIGTSGIYDSVNTAIAGSYGGGDAEAFELYLHGGYIGNNVMGGSVNGTANLGKVTIVMNDGTINGNLYGGSFYADDTSEANRGNINQSTIGQAAITINGGTINGDLVAGGNAGEIGQVVVTINGGIIKGHITQGTARRTDDATTQVNIVGHYASIGGDISADTVTLKDVSESGVEAGFDQYKGTITATDKLVLDTVTTDLHMKVSVSEIEVKNSATSLIMGERYDLLESLTLSDNSQFGAFKTADRTPTSDNETTLTLTHLIVGKNATLNANIVMGKDSTLSLADALTMGSSVSLSDGMTIHLSDEMLAALNDRQWITLFDGINTAEGDSLTVNGNLLSPDEYSFITLHIDGATGGNLYHLHHTNVGDVRIALIPEPTTATLSLLALAALATRRRRTHS